MFGTQAVCVAHDVRHPIRMRRAVGDWRTLVLVFVTSDGVYPKSDAPNLKQIRNRNIRNSKRNAAKSLRSLRNEFFSPHAEVVGQPQGVGFADAATAGEDFVDRRAGDLG